MKMGYASLEMAPRGLHERDRMSTLFLTNVWDFLRHASRHAITWPRVGAAQRSLQRD
jgi:hypothetical protein